MMETDLLLMSLVIFVPSIFALGLIFFRKEWVNAMRWWSLTGTAATMGLSLAMFISYHAQVVDKHKPTSPGAVEGENKFKESVEERRESATLYSRTHQAGQNPVDPEKSDDWVSRTPWIEQFHIDYFLGADGISMALILMTTILSFLAMIASWSITKFVRGYMMLFLILETGMIGTFLALDFFLFFIFWEVMLLPMYFLIGVWGGPRREYAAVKFFIYTLLGSAFILIAILAFYFTDVQDFVGNKDPKTGLYQGNKGEEKHTFDIILLSKVGKEASKIIRGAKDSQLALAQKAVEGAPADQKEAAEARVKRLEDQLFFQKGFQITMFLLLFVGFAIKLPMFPFHTWLPDAHVEAPTPISMILAGVLLKMGGYGIIRIAYPICPFAAQDLAMMIAIFGMINLVYGAFAAMAQTDFKKLVAYSSVSHMGYVLLGIAIWPTEGNQYWSWGMNGAMFQMIAHGISSAGMFFMVGVIYERAHHRNLNAFGGLYEPMPLYGGISAIIFFAAMGLPGMCGFVGEFMVVLGTWNFNKALAIIAALVVVITAAYILWTVQRVFMGTNEKYKDYKDMNWREIACAAPLVALCVLLGVMPFLVLDWMEPSVTQLVHSLFTSSIIPR